MSAESTTAPKTQPRFLSLGEATAFAGISKSTLQRYEKAGTFPARRRLGPGRVAWVVSELEEWAQEREPVPATDELPSGEGSPNGSAP